MYQCRTRSAASAPGNAKESVRHVGPAERPGQVGLPGGSHTRRESEEHRSEPRFQLNRRIEHPPEDIGERDSINRQTTGRTRGKTNGKLHPGTDTQPKTARSLPSHRAKGLFRQEKASFRHRSGIRIIILNKTKVPKLKNSSKIQLRMDPGASTTGMAVTRNYPDGSRDALMALEITHQGKAITRRLIKRRQLRRGRRYRKTRYRMPRFNNPHPDGRLAAAQPLVPAPEYPDLGQKTGQAAAHTGHPRRNLSLRPPTPEKPGNQGDRIPKGPPLPNQPPLRSPPARWQ